MLTGLTEEVTRHNSMVGSLVPALFLATGIVYFVDKMMESSVE